MSLYRAGVIVLYILLYSQCFYVLEMHNLLYEDCDILPIDYVEFNPGVVNQLRAIEDDNKLWM